MKRRTPAELHVRPFMTLHKTCRFSILLCGLVAVVTACQTIPERIELSSPVAPLRYIKFKTLPSAFDTSEFSEYIESGRVSFIPATAFHPDVTSVLASRLDTDMGSTFEGAEVSIARLLLWVGRSYGGATPVPGHKYHPSAYDPRPRLRLGEWMLIETKTDSYLFTAITAFVNGREHSVSCNRKLSGNSYSEAFTALLDSCGSELVAAIKEGRQ